MSYDNNNYKDEDENPPQFSAPLANGDMGSPNKVASVPEESCLESEDEMREVRIVNVDGQGRTRSKPIAFNKNFKEEHEKQHHSGSSLGSCKTGATVKVVPVPTGSGDLPAERSIEDTDGSSDGWISYLMRILGLY